MKRVLICEDEKPLARAVFLKLEKEGIFSEIASDGEEALFMVTKNKYDLILLDLMMPKRDGFSVLEEAHTAGIKTEFVVMSNLSQDVDEKKAKSMGVKKYFVKTK